MASNESRKRRTPEDVTGKWGLNEESGILPDCIGNNSHSQTEGTTA
jgi:hypothetical protein